jgi:CopA family copper-resistance protein
LKIPKRSAVLSRRHFVEGMAFAGGLAGLGLPRRAFAASSPTLSGRDLDLTVGQIPFNVTGRRRIATAVNNSVPAPTLRFREGDAVTIRVANALREPTSIHWHGLRLPNAMDGVPGLTFKGIMPGETFTYRFPIVQSGTYWYHSHSGSQEQTGLYGALILDPKEKESYLYDREYVVMLSDWTDEDPMEIVSNLREQSDYYNYGQRTLGTFFDDAGRNGLSSALNDRLMWGKMRMSPTDIMDVTGATYTFLINGQPPAANWTGLFNPGERIRLRFINGSSMSTFDVRIPGLAMTVVQADGSDVVPVEIDEFRIGLAETYDVIVNPPKEGAYTIFAQAQDRSGYARATLTSGQGLAGEIPAMDPRPVRSMTDMGMGGMGMAGMADMPGMDMSVAKPAAANAMSGMDMPPTPAAPPAAPDAMPGMTMGGMNMPGMDMSRGMSSDAMPMGGMTKPAMAAIPSSNADGVDPSTFAGNPNVESVAMSTKNRSGEAGDGLDGNGRRVLTYADLVARVNEDNSPPSRELQFHLTGNMERFTWGFDGKKFSEAGPINLKLGERVRFLLINDTMMEHPIHLHGFLFRVENGRDRLPVKHTINVKPAERVGIVFTADTPGHWAFHCHLMYHMDMGMFRTVLVA